MGQGLRKGKKRNERVRLGTGHGTAGQPVVRPGCSLFSGHQRATHAWLNRPRAQAPDWHQDRALKPLWSPGLTRVPLPCSSLQCLLFGPQRGEVRLLSSYLSLPSASPGTQGSQPCSRPEPGCQFASLVDLRLSLVPPTLASAPSCFPTGGSMLRAR